MFLQGGIGFPAALKTQQRLGVMSRNRQPRKPVALVGKEAQTELVLDLDRYIPALITFIANKLSRSATVLSPAGVLVRTLTEWRIFTLPAIEPGISAALACCVIGFNKRGLSAER